MRRGERPILQLPRPLLLGFAAIFAVQLLWHHVNRPRIEAEYRPLSEPYDAATYRGLAAGSEHLIGYLLSIRLQLHDNQVGRHFSYRLIDYDRLVAWLERLSDIAPGTEYPMLLASRIYSQVQDEQRLRRLLAFIERRFEDNPQLHWRRLAEACLLAKHRLGDLQLALRLAEMLALQPAGVKMPHWARDFRILLLADLNEYESAIAIIEGLLEPGVIDDPDERRFLQEKLSDFQQKLFESQQKTPN